MVTLIECNSYFCGGKKLNLCGNKALYSHGFIGQNLSVAICELRVNKQLLLRRTDNAAPYVHNIPRVKTLTGTTAARDVCS